MEEDNIHGLHLIREILDVMLPEIFDDKRQE